jgi:hypothetical protein
MCTPSSTLRSTVEPTRAIVSSTDFLYSFPRPGTSSRTAEETREASSKSTGLAWRKVGGGGETYVQRPSLQHESHRQQCKSSMPLHLRGQWQSGPGPYSWEDHQRGGYQTGEARWT